jgi:hypothetical protein
MMRAQPSTISEPMLREAKNVQIVPTRAMLQRRYTVFVGKLHVGVVWKPSAFDAMQAAQPHEPVPLVQHHGRQAVLVVRWFLLVGGRRPQR